MSKQTVPDLKELFKQAAEIAAQVPESMQEAAFNRAIDLLTGVGADVNSNISNSKATKKPRAALPQTSAPKDDSPAADLVETIDSTQHPGILSARKVLDRALMVLQIALNEHGVDGLTPAKIARVLTDKFRVSTTTDAVRMALGDATNLVNRVTKGKGYEYRIMGPGEEYLAHLGEGEASIPSPKTKTKSKKIAKKKTNSKTGTNSKSPSKTKVGPKAAILSLIDSGFFSQARTGPEIKTHLKNKRGLNFETTQLSMALLRLVRDEKLDRDENADRSYEYKQS
jgi:hypothetical protein|tara:strand:- start:307 stop:1155 length:849 start_codon:yes stop_codon:yes gene_type:complete